MTNTQIIIKFMSYEWGCTHKTDKYGYHQCEEGVTIPALKNPDIHKEDDFDGHGFSFKQLKFSSDWKFLMPVIEKILSLKFEDGENYYLRTFGMKDENNNYMVRINRHQLFTEKNLIKSAYLAVSDCLRRLSN